jgi:molybdate transport system regulatory protein
MLKQSHRLRIRGKVWLEARGRFALGDGGVRLLRAIGATGSVRAAADRVGWSYRHTLSYLANAESALGLTLVTRSRGGNARGGATLTDDGRDFVDRYERLRAALNDTLLHLYDATFRARAREDRR